MKMYDVDFSVLLVRYISTDRSRIPSLIIDVTKTYIYIYIIYIFKYCIHGNDILPDLVNLFGVK